MRLPAVIITGLRPVDVKFTILVFLRVSRQRLCSGFAFQHRPTRSMSLKPPDTDPALAGAGYALLAYLAWGLMPIYWKWVAAVPPLEMVAHRVAWSVLVLLALVAWRRRFGALAAALVNRRDLALLFATAVLVSFNWLTFIFAVQNEYVVEASLGYYINPLLNVVLGMVFLGERLRPWQWLAVVLAALGVGWLTVASGVLPWISLILAGSFGVYGLLRKVAKVDGIIGLTVETLLMLPLTLVYLLYLQAAGAAGFPSGDLTLDLLVPLAGLVTALPLLWFANAARRLRYSTLGFFQYLAPSCQLLLAVLVYGEPFTVHHGVAFGCIWGALAIYTLDTTRALRRVS